MGTSAAFGVWESIAEFPDLLLAQVQYRRSFSRHSAGLSGGLSDADGLARPLVG